MLPPIHVIDFEGNRMHGIMEFGLVTLEEGQVGDIFHGQSHRPTTPKSTFFREHSRFQGDAAQHSFAEYLPLFREKRQSGFFCAHNATVEDRLLRQYALCPEIGKNITAHPLPHATPECRFSAQIQQPQLKIIPTAAGTSWGPWIDTYRIYRKYYSMAKNYTLAELIRHFRLETELKSLLTQHANGKKLTFHRAIDDTLATALLLQNFIHLFRIHDIHFLFLR
jgi:DNA polymerase III epsilon subunit-like protein